MEYGFLTPVLQGFIRRELDALQQAKHNEADIDSFEAKLNQLVNKGTLTKEEAAFITSSVLRAHLDDDYNRLCLIADLQAEYSAYLATTGDEARVIFSPRVIKTPARRLALDWSLIHLGKLSFLGGAELLKGLDFVVKQPYRQCFYCGSIWDEHGARFSDKKKNANYCHALGCAGGSSTSPADHPNCCYGDWLHLYRKFKARFDEIKKTKQNEMESKATEKFSQLLDELYIFNCGKTWEVEERAPEKESAAKAAYDKRITALIAKIAPTRRSLTATQVKEEAEWFIQTRSALPGFKPHELWVGTGGKRISLKEYEALSQEESLAYWYADKISPRKKAPPGWW